MLYTEFFLSSRLAQCTDYLSEIESVKLDKRDNNDDMPQSSKRLTIRTGDISNKYPMKSISTHSDINPQLVTNPGYYVANDYPTNANLFL